MKRPVYTLFLIAFITVIQVDQIFSSLWVVPDQFETIQQGIEMSLDGDTVLVHSGTYHENINFLGRAITVGSMILLTDSSHYIRSTIIDGDSIDCVVVFENEEDDRSILRGFTITNGFQWFGGGIDCQINCRAQLIDLYVVDNYAMEIGGGIYCTWSASPRITNVIITENLSRQGAGFGSAHYAHPILNNVLIENNHAENDGGGVFCGHGNGEISIFNSTIINNHADRGGGLNFETSDSNFIQNTIIKNNTAASAGGGMICFRTTLTIQHTSIDSNTVDSGYGGGIANEYYSEIVIDSCLIQGNIANQGGGIGTKDFGIANIYRSIILNNSSIVGGAAYTSDQSSIRLLNSIFWENVADSAGGGLYTTKGALHLVANSVLWNNSPEEIYSYTTPILLANKILIRNSDIEGGEEGIQHHQRDSIFYFENNFDVDPGFAFPDTMNFHYSEESPCVDAGTHFLVYYGDTLMNLSEEEYDGVAPDVGVHEYDGPREIQEQDLSPRSFALLNAYPNPFNSTLTVVCQLPKSSKATLSLVNIRGQELMTLYSGTKHSGEYRLNLSLRDYPSGTYFLRLQSPGEDLLKRVQLMK